MNRPPNEPSRLAGWTVEDHLEAPPVTVFLQETRFYPQPRSGFEAPRCLNGTPIHGTRVPVGGVVRNNQKRAYSSSSLSCLEPTGVIELVTSAGSGSIGSSRASRPFEERRGS